MAINEQISQCERDILEKKLLISGYSPWIDIKIALFLKYFTQIESTQSANKSADSGKLKLILQQAIFFNWVKFLYKAAFSDYLYFGAVSAIYTNHEKQLDLFYPKELPLNRTLFLFHTAATHRIDFAKKYLRSNAVLMYNPFVTLVSKFLAPFAALMFRSFRKKLSQDISEILVKHNLPLPLNRIQQIVLQFWLRKNINLLFLWPLRIMGAKTAYVVSAYTKSDTVAALKDLGILVNELQHGFIAKSHPGYNYQKSLLNAETLPIPDRLWVYDQSIRNELDANTVFDLSRTNIKPNPKIELAETFQSPFGHKKIILFTGQQQYMDDIGKFFEESLKNLRDEYILVYRPHPKEPEDFYKRLSDIADNENIAILSDFTVLTESIIKISAAHVSVYSSCHYEAVKLKGKTFILNCQKNNPFLGNAEDSPKQFQIISSAFEIIEQLQHVTE